MKIWGLWYADGYGLPHRSELMEFPSKTEAWNMMDARFYGFHDGKHFPLCSNQNLSVFHEKPSDDHHDWYPDEIFCIDEKVTKNGRTYTKRVEKP
jgi:hypothetical protein